MHWGAVHKFFNATKELDEKFKVKLYFFVTEGRDSNVGEIGLPYSMIGWFDLESWLNGQRQQLG